MPLNILFVIPYVPSIVRGRSYAFIRGLAALGCRVTLACLVQPASEARYLADIAPYCAEVHALPVSRPGAAVRSLASIPTPQPLSVAYCRQPDFGRLVKSLAGQDRFDVVHTEFIRAAPFTMHLAGKPRVFDAVDNLTLAYRRSLTAACVPLKQKLVSFIEWMKMRRYEPWAADHYEQLIVCSPLDKQEFGRAGRAGVVIPNGVDLDYFRRYEGTHQAETIVFLGKMSYYVNVASVLWFYREIFPLIRRQRPHVHLNILGRDPVASIRALSQDPDVTVTGTVPDVRPYLQQAAVAISPMVAGSGMQFKLLEAMAVGVPVVTTSFASKGLLAVADRDFIVADEAYLFAESVLKLLNSDEEHRQMTDNGRLFVERYHDWSQLVAQLNSVYRSMLNGIFNEN
jgi:polysaccharide biosynthesis protein PslH